MPTTPVQEGEDHPGGRDRKFAARAANKYPQIQYPTCPNMKQNAAPRRDPKMDPLPPFFFYPKTKKTPFRFFLYFILFLLPFVASDRVPVCAVERASPRTHGGLRGRRVHGRLPAAGGKQRRQLGEWGGPYKRWFCFERSHPSDNDTPHRGCSRG